MHSQRGLGTPTFWGDEKQILHWVDSKIGSYFSPFVDQSSPDYVSSRGRDHSLQRHFSIVDILFCSGYIRDRSAIFGAISVDFDTNTCGILVRIWIRWVCVK